MVAGFCNISNVLTITTEIDRKSDGLLEYAQLKGLWDGSVGIFFLFYYFIEFYVVEIITPYYCRENLIFVKYLVVKKYQVVKDWMLGINY